MGDGMEGKRRGVGDSGVGRRRGRRVREGSRQMRLGGGEEGKGMVGVVERHLQRGRGGGSKEGRCRGKERRRRGGGRGE